MRIRTLLLGVFISILSLGYTQSDLLELKTGQVQDVIFILGNIPGENDTLNYKLLKSTELLSIPMSKVQKLTLSDGYVLFESKTPLPITKKEEIVSKEETINADKIVFKNGQVSNVVLLLEDMPTSESILKYKEVDSEEIKTIAVTELQSISLSDGYILYEAKEEILVPEVENVSAKKKESVTPKIENESGLETSAIQNEPTSSIDSLDNPLERPVTIAKPQIFSKKSNCTGDVEELKRKIDYEAVMLYNKLVDEIDYHRSQQSIATNNMNEQFKTELYKAIKDEVNLLKCSNSTVDAEITIEVDTLGKAIKFNDEVISSSQLRNYTNLRENTIYPYIRNYTFNTVDTLFNYSEEINDFFEKNEKEIEASNCPNEFDEVLAIAKSRFAKIDKLILSKNTIYTLPINYSYKSIFQTWILYDRGLQIVNKKSKNTNVTDRKILDGFDSKLSGKKKNGKYLVNTCIYKNLNDSIQMSVMNVKRKYTYYVHIGVNASTIIPLENTDYNLKIGEIIPIEGMIIFHRFGFFGGYGIKGVKPLEETTIDDGVYLSEHTKYFHGGIYIGIAQYLYIKAGYTHLNRELVTYQNSVEINRGDNETIHGFMTGLSLIFPVVQLEGGYNHSFKAPYVSAGLNIPLNK